MISPDAGQQSPAPAATLPTAAEVLEAAERSLDDDKAEGAIVIDLAGRSSMADYLIIATGRSTRHVGAMAENLRERLRARGVRGIEIEGLPHCDWVLIDGGDVIVHLFRAEVRAFYNLEKMWGVESPVTGLTGLAPVSAEGGYEDDEYGDDEVCDDDDAYDVDSEA